MNSSWGGYSRTSHPQIRMQHDVPLLWRLGAQIRQAFPIFSPLSAQCRIARPPPTYPQRHLRVLPLRAEQSVDPTSSCPPRECRTRSCPGRPSPASESDNPRSGSCPRRSGFPPPQGTICDPLLDARKHQKLALKFHGAGVERCVHANALHQVGVALVVES